MTAPPVDRTRWERLLSEQTDIFAATMDRNATLETKVEDLQRELNVWKLAMATAEKEAKAAVAQVATLQRQVGSLTVENPLVLVLLDGDGCIFQQELLNLGAAGGSKAAALLTRGINAHLEEELGARRADIWVTIFLNKRGLAETLAANNMCTTDEFDAFIQAFNQSAPLYSIVDVGYGKEAADSKIKECLRTFARFPQTVKVFFGGAHDNGYSASLKYLEHENLLSKVVLLKGYTEIAQELRNLNLPTADIDGLFMTKKIGFFKKPMLQNSISNPEVIRVRTAPPTPSKLRPKHDNVPIGPLTNLSKLNPPPCNLHYLSVCPAGAECRYGHHYKLSPEQIENVRRNAKKSPCAAANRNQPCPQGDQCTMGHLCPRGYKCVFFKNGKCKFVGINMHDAEPEGFFRGKGANGTDSSAEMYAGDGGDSDEIVLNFENMGEELAALGIQPTH
ncbi:hypothetical protein AURDEDRAFT_78286 [Auricularia subglabra TFB-10046 SS5]|nr:hypothetical protein AURDEDRAFT_78286 [Auricularia subglabra TFB-10046 SS5]